MALDELLAVTAGGDRTLVYYTRTCLASKVAAGTHLGLASLSRVKQQYKLTERFTGCVSFLRSPGRRTAHRDDEESQPVRTRDDEILRPAGAGLRMTNRVVPSNLFGGA